MVVMVVERWRKGVGVVSIVRAQFETQQARRTDERPGEWHACSDVSWLASRTLGGQGKEPARGLNSENGLA